MHRIIKSHLDNFSRSFGFENIDEADQFEKFVNYCVIFQRASAGFDLSEITTGEEDDGIDGVAVLIDEELIISQEDAETVFKSGKKNHDVEIVFTQTKRTDSFETGDFLKFKEGILKFITSEIYNVSDCTAHKNSDHS